MPDDAPEYVHLGQSFDDKPLLRQLGKGERRVFPLRFVTVQAASERAAKRIQVDYRKGAK